MGPFQLDQASTGTASPFNISLLSRLEHTPPMVQGRLTPATLGLATHKSLLTQRKVFRVVAENAGSTGHSRPKCT